MFRELIFMSKLSWFPYPKAWIMAIKLQIPAYFGACVIFGSYFWLFFLFALVFLSSDLEASTLCFMISAGVIFLGLIWFLLIVGIYQLFLKFLWSNPPKWLALPNFQTLVIRDFGILIIDLLQKWC